MNMRARQGELIHDVRNRLAVVRANVEAFIDGKLAPSLDRLAAVLQSLDQLEALLDEIKPTTTVSEPGVHAVEIDVCDLLQREYRAIEGAAAEKGVTLNIFRCPVKSAPCASFIGDPVRIGQIVSNVMLNAVRYTPSGGTIRVDCTHQADQLQVTVTDSGPGTAPDERNRIFQRGVRGRAARKTPGSGMGLAIAKEFVEAQGGSIEALPSDKGARFMIRLPGTVFAQAPNAAQCRTCAAEARAHRRTVRTST